MNNIKQEELLTIQEMIENSKVEMTEGGREKRVINCRGCLSIAQFHELTERIRNFHCFRNFSDRKEQGGVNPMGVKYIRPFSVSFNADTRDWRIFNLTLCGWDTVVFVGSTHEDDKNSLPMYDAIIQYLYAKCENSVDYKHKALSYSKVLELEGLDDVFRGDPAKEQFYRGHEENKDFYNEMLAVHRDFMGEGEVRIMTCSEGDNLNGYMVIHADNGHVVLTAIDGEPLFKGKVNELSQLMQVIDMVGLTASY